MKWNNLDTMPQESTKVWILNEEYGSGNADPLCQRPYLKIREASYHRGAGWYIYEYAYKVSPRVKFWTHITDIEELPPTWETPKNEM